VLIKSKYFNGRFEKIAQSLLGEVVRNSPEYGSADKEDLTETPSENLNISNTISKVRKNADIQPLHKDTRINDIPRDIPFAIKMRDKQDHLSHLEDKRITHYQSNRR